MAYVVVAVLATLCAAMQCISPCAFYDMAEDMEPGTGVMHLVLGVIFPLAPLFLLRGQAREKSGIEGGAVGDFCTVLCCPGCAHLQQYKEVNPQKSLVCGESTVE